MRFPHIVKTCCRCCGVSAGLMEGITTHMPRRVIIYRQTNMRRIAPAPSRSEVGRGGRCGFEQTDAVHSGSTICEQRLKHADSLLP